jgi:hypothetical protein
MPHEDIDCVDEPAIADNEMLWRAVHQTQLTRDHAGRIKPQSGAFRDALGRLSVDIASLTRIEEFQLRNAGKFAAQFLVRTVRDLGKCVTNRVDIDPANPAHAIVCPKLSAKEARILSDAADIWVQPPPEDSVPLKPI